MRVLLLLLLPFLFLLWHLAPSPRALLLLCVPWPSPLPTPNTNNAPLPFAPLPSQPAHRPKTGDGSYEAYRLPSVPSAAGWGCRNQQLCDAFRGLWVYRTRWVLPAGFKCDHCKLVWTWTTGHRCWPRCGERDPPAVCRNRQVYGDCGAPGTAYPE